MPTPRSVRALSAGRFEATCGACLASSPVLAVPDVDAAWVELQRLRWSLRPGRDYAICPKCTADPPNVDRNAAAAMKRRKRK